MRKATLVCFCCVLSVILFIPGPAAGKVFRVEVLQVTKIEPFDKTYSGFIKALGEKGLVQGSNLTVKRTIVDFDVEKGGLWQRIGVLRRLKSEASRIIGEKPDLVLTIGTPATKHTKDKIIAAGIPVVFSAVAMPTAAGCKSMTEAGPGFTGATLYMSMKDILSIIRLAFPKVNTMAIVHSDDENAVAQVQEAKNLGPAMGINFLTKEVGKSEPITPHARELAGKGAKAFIVPLDTYYGLRNYENSLTLHELRKKELHVPAISLALMKVPGAAFYVGSDFGYIGELSGEQAAKILKDGVKPETLPIAKQKTLNILVDERSLKEFNVVLPMEILQIAKPAI